MQLGVVKSCASGQLYRSIETGLKEDLAGFESHFIRDALLLAEVDPCAVQTLRRVAVFQNPVAFIGATHCFRHSLRPGQAFSAGLILALR